jgi:hypothetical protein
VAGPPAAAARPDAIKAIRVRRWNRGTVVDLGGQLSNLREELIHLLDVV